MQNLAPELCVLICTFIDGKSLLRLEQTCRQWKNLVADSWVYLLRHGRLGVVMCDRILPWTETWTLKKAIVSQLLKRCIMCRHKSKALCPFTCCIVCPQCASMTPRFMKIGRTRARYEYFLTDSELKSIRCIKDASDWELRSQIESQPAKPVGWQTLFLVSDIEAAAHLKFGGRDGFVAMQEKARARKQKYRDAQIAKKETRKQALLTRLGAEGLEWDDTCSSTHDYLCGYTNLDSVVQNVRRWHILKEHVGFSIVDGVRDVLNKRFGYIINISEAERYAYQIFRSANTMYFEAGFFPKSASLLESKYMCSCGERLIPDLVARQFATWKSCQRGA